ncbi:hypothetical protein Zm00014a_007817 [Zea mays]|uniref:Uncharacterized protein n=1 Tax=Zea mays TaxID=4577 RepID=A0A3L6EBC2_MAIZE|nr:hypothetical protein Zm00014a_007817 [Zea mays]
MVPFLRTSASVPAILAPSIGDYIHASRPFCPFHRWKVPFQGTSASAPAIVAPLPTVIGTPSINTLHHLGSSEAKLFIEMALVVFGKNGGLEQIGSRKGYVDATTLTKISEDRDDAIDLEEWRARRSRVRSGGEEDWLVVTDGNADCRADRATSTRDQGVLCHRRGGQYKRFASKGLLVDTYGFGRIIQNELVFRLRAYAQRRDLYARSGFVSGDGGFLLALFLALRLRNTGAGLDLLESERKA